MRTLSEIFKSIVKSYNNNETLNFVDLRDLDTLLQGTEIAKSFISTYNNNEQINYTQLRTLENLTK